MGDVGDYWRDAKIARDERKAKRLAAADPTGWTQHTLSLVADTQRKASRLLALNRKVYV